MLKMSVLKTDTIGYLKPRMKRVCVARLAGAGLPEPWKVCGQACTISFVFLVFKGAGKSAREADARSVPVGWRERSDPWFSEMARGLGFGAGRSAHSKCPSLDARVEGSVCMEPCTGGGGRTDGRTDACVRCPLADWPPRLPLVRSGCSVKHFCSAAYS